MKLVTDLAALGDSMTDDELDDSLDDGIPRAVARELRRQMKAILARREREAFERGQEEAQRELKAFAPLHHNLAKAKPVPGPGGKKRRMVSDRNGDWIETDNPQTGDE